LDDIYEKKEDIFSSVSQKVIRASCVH